MRELREVLPYSLPVYGDRVYVTRRKVAAFGFVLFRWCTTVQLHGHQRRVEGEGWRAEAMRRLDPLLPPSKEKVTGGVTTRNTIWCMTPLSSINTSPVTFPTHTVHPACISVNTLTAACGDTGPCSTVRFSPGDRWHVERKDVQE